MTQGAPEPAATIPAVVPELGGMTLPPPPKTGGSGIAIYGAEISGLEAGLALALLGLIVIGATLAALLLRRRLVSRRRHVQQISRALELARYDPAQAAQALQRIAQTCQKSMPAEWQAQIDTLMFERPIQSTEEALSLLQALAEELRSCSVAGSNAKGLKS